MKFLHYKMRRKPLTHNRDRFFPEAKIGSRDNNRSQIVETFLRLGGWPCRECTMPRASPHNGALRVIVLNCLADPCCTIAFPASETGLPRGTSEARKAWLDPAVPIQAAVTYATTKIRLPIIS